MRAARLFLVLAVVLLSATVGAQSPQKLHLQIIEVGSEKEAQEILNRLRKGADFSAIAKEKSSDATAKDGGDMGEVDPKELRRELREEVVGIAPGSTSGVIRLPGSFVILKVLPASKTTGVTKQSATIAMAAYGNVRPSANISGLLEAELAFQNTVKEEDWGQDLNGACRIRKESIAKNKAMLEQYLAAAHEGVDGVTPVDIVQARFALSQLNTYEGSLDSAIQQLHLLYQYALQKFPSFIPQAVEALGVNQLHASEMASNIYRKPGDRCLVPIGGRSTPAMGIGDAVATFETYDRHIPDDLEVRWLLNLAHMYQGDYPDKVSQRLLIPPTVFESREQVPRFRDVATQIGLDAFSMAGGLIADDFDNDGLLDVVKSSFNMCDSLSYFKNNGSGSFTDQSHEAGFEDQLGGLNINQADYDNDGCLDVLVMRGGWEWPMRRSLLKGNCKGQFKDVTRESGLGTPMAASQSAVWADIDNDGFLDLFVANEQGASQLFLNKKDGTFQEIGKSAGVDAVTVAKGAVAADYDNDGWMDIYVSNLYGENFLYHNNHDRTFTEVAAVAGVQKPLASFATWFFDYDNDGWQDLFVTSYYMSAEESVRSRLGLPVNAETLKLYRNLGNGKFQDVTAQTGLDRVLMPMGGNFGDFDNDGYLDMYMGSGSPSLVALIPYVLWHNDSGKHFTDVSASAGMGELHKGHAVAFADLRNSGQDDILAVVGGAVPSDAHAMRVFANPGNDNDWLELKLIGKKTNRSAIGARIKLIVQNGDGNTREIYRVVSSGGSFGSSPLRQHVGLGPKAKVLELSIGWPVSRTQQRFVNVRPNQLIEIRESEDKVVPVKTRTFDYGK